MSTIDILGLDEVLAALDAEEARIEIGAQNAVAEAVENTYDKSQARVPYDAVTRHKAGYVHLKDSGEKKVNGLEGSVSYGTDHAEYVEHGTSRMQAQPYLFPPFEDSQQQLVKACEELLQ